MKYVLKALDECATRLEVILKKLQNKEKLGKRDLNNLEWCVDNLKTTKKALEIDLKPVKPKTLQNAIAYVTSKKKDGTFIALLAEDNHLIKTMYITAKILTELPKFEVTVTPVEMKMNKIELSIPNLDFLKSIPKCAKNFVVIAKNGTDVKVIK